MPGTHSRQWLLAQAATLPLPPFRLSPPNGERTNRKTGIARVYIAQATPTGWQHLVYAWGLRDPLPSLPIPLLGSDRALLDLSACFRAAYDRIAADDEADYADSSPLPPLRPDDLVWAEALLRQHGLRPS